MERCKIIRDGDDENAEDRISELPNALILKILSLLPKEEAIVTSVLSKQWQSLWKMMPKLEFCFFKDENNSREFENFSINVFKVLLSHMALVLQSLQLNINVPLDTSINNAKCTRMFIRIALARNVRELVILNSFRSWFRFPKSFYKSQTLENLELTSIGFMEVPCSSSSWCLNSLTTLQLNRVDFKDEESFVKFLSGCPNLENLMVCKRSQSNVKTFTIAVPSLQRLTIYDCSCDDDEWRRGYVINAPCLKYLEIHVATYHHIGFFLIENVPYNKLVEANLIVNFEITNEKLLESLSSSVKRLSLKLSPSSLKFSIGGSIFYQLVYLELHTNEVAWWNLLSLMLDIFPKLQVLKLIDRMCGGKKDFPEYGKWNQPKNVPGCLLTFIWEGYRWKRQDEIKVAKYILSNTNRLKTATFFYSILMDLKERVEMVEELNSVVRASNSCQLLFC